MNVVLTRTLGALLALAIVCSSPDAAADPAGESRDYLSLNQAQRREALAGKSKDEKLEMLRKVAPAALMKAGISEVKALGTYSAKLIKSERVDGTTYSQAIDVLIREEPFAARLSFVSGAGKGRKVLYNAELRANELRVKEGGVLGIAGGIWLNIDSSLTRRESRHSVTKLGLGALLGILDKNRSDAEAFGGMRRKDEVFDDKGRYVVTWESPPEAKDLYAPKTRVWVDAVTTFPVIVEVSDEEGLRERYEWQNIEPAKVDADTFTPDAFGL